MPENRVVVVNGWTLFFHPLILDEIDFLIERVEKLRNKDPLNYVKKNVSKRLAAIVKLVFHVIPRNPEASEYRLGLTLGNEHKHWFRAKFFQQYRLFFRFDSASRIIVFAWVNDEKNKRVYGGKTDAYRVFEKMLGQGCPPDNWEQLLLEAKGGLDRLDEIAGKLPGS